MTNAISFGTWLRQRRKALDLTQEDLAERADCSITTIRKFESSERRPSREVAELLGECLGIPPEERQAFVAFARGQTGLLTAPPIARPDTSTPTNLPAQVTPLIGRERDVEVVIARLMRDDVRLLTLVGPPGIGKTRLSIQVAAELLQHFSDGVYFVPLAPVTDPDLAAVAVADALEVQDQGGGSAVDGLKNYLKDKRLLLVLDNFEQIVAAAPLIADLLIAAPSLRMLVTSREVLHIRGEQQFAVPPLALPDNGQTASAQALSVYPAIELFVERAQAVRPDFALTEANAYAVADICTRLEGLPLAIELAAARINLFSPEELRTRLNSRLQMLTGGARDLPARQQTLRSAVAWSYDLLTRDEQTLFRRFGVFAGGWTLGAAEAVCNPDSRLAMPVMEYIASLLDKSLLKHEALPGQESRYSMLEMLREYALERLAESGEEQDMRRLHSEYFLTLVEAAEAELRGPDQAAWLSRLDADADNLRAALDWLQSPEGDLQSALRMAGMLAWYWELRGRMREGRERLRALLSRPDASESTLARALALNGAGRLAHDTNENIAARPLLEESAAIAREVDDHWLEAVALHNLGNVTLALGDLSASRSVYEESLALSRELADRWLVAWGLIGVGHAAFVQRDYQEARRYYEESLVVRTEADDTWGIARSLNELGDIARLQGDYDGARTYYERSLATHQELGHATWLAMGLYNLACTLALESNYAQAAPLFDEGLSLFIEQGDRVAGAMCLVGVALIGAESAQPEVGARLLGAVERVFEELQYHMDPSDLLTYEPAQARLREELGEEVFASLRTEGRTLSLEEAAGLAHKLLAP
jgi:predicted ATPase/transcriptional regulator with XRE-family HTH domain